MEIDKGFEVYNIYKSICTNCKYFDMSKRKCKAFPNGVPSKYLDGTSQHRSVDENQTGDYVFKQI